MLIFSLILIAAAIAADQVIKYLVITNLKPDGVIQAIPGWLNFIYLENKGAAFGSFQGYTWILTVVTAILIAASLFIMIFYQRHTFFSRAAAILIIGGGIGNLIDRILLGYVVDYIQVSFFPPVFNLADCFVVVGVLFFLLHMLFFAEKDDGRERVIRRYRR